MNNERNSISANMGRSKGKPMKFPPKQDKPIPQNPNKANHIVKDKNKNG